MTLLLPEGSSLAAYGAFFTSRTPLNVEQHCTLGIERQLIE